ncbi:SdpI family protein [Pseudonocardia acaciae]|uniref:SdpI family protein n=1 Tax=Pseudonocardia acaciae TaxID=551276 RepID=UPI001FE1F571|nr:SdpI family protein [Pseudonocardia acaciae]
MGTAFEVVAGVLVLGGVGLAVVGVLGVRRRLPRNRFAGVRTVNTLRDDETFAVGNQVAAPLTIASGAVAAVGGVAGLAAPSGAVAVTLLVLAGLGAVVLTVAGGVLGDRAAKRVPLPRFTGCGGACGCCTAAAACAAAGDEAEERAEA